MRSRICDYMVGDGIELGPEPVCGLDLVQQEIAQRAACNRTRNLVLDIPANIGDVPIRNSDAPSIAVSKLGYRGRLTAAPQCHISRRKVDGPAALACLRTATGRKNQRQLRLTRRVLGDKIASTIYKQGRAAHAAKCQKRQLADRNFAGDVTIWDRDQIGANPLAAKLFPPRLVARPAGLPRILPTNDRRGHGTAPLSNRTTLTKQGSERQFARGKRRVVSPPANWLFGQANSLSM